jgi:lipid A ethanolaminephosphotransferase
MVVGETARADHFSLNGYSRETNPLLKKEKIINLPHVSSCGTSTAHSVPCMFSIYERDDYSYKKGIGTENLLDVLNHTNQVDILWRDNNSDSKGVALRVPFEDYKTAQTNTICDEECQDEGMLVGLNEYIQKRKGKDILIVLHQMGNHGPAYNRRYTEEFEKFTPVCKTNQLEECSQESINNAYDNALLHTDHFLSEVIQLLKEYDNSHKTSMIYMSDHGESLGEHGLYLHGLPYFMAPDAQTHVGALVWFGEKNQKEIDPNKAYSHDNLFHTLLGLFEVKTKVYKKELDMFK